MDPRTKQRKEALEKANEIRSARAKMKVQFKSGRLLPLEPLDDLPEWLETATAEEYLRWVPGIGKVKARRLRLSMKLSSGRTLGRLTEKQMEEFREIVRRGYSRAVIVNARERESTGHASTARGEPLTP